MLAAWSSVVGCGDDVVLGAPPADASVDGGDDAEVGNDGAPVTSGSSECTDEWTDLQLGTDQDDQLWGMTSDREGNLYLAGFEGGLTGVTDIEPAGSAKGVVIRMSPGGAVQWKAVLDTDGADTVEHVAIEPVTGAVYAVGRTSGAFAGFVNGGQFDGFLAELDAAGRSAAILQWGDERPQHPARIALGPRGELAIAGYDDVYVPSNYVEALENGFVGGFDRAASAPGFTQRFLQRSSSHAMDRMTDVAVDRDGSLFVTSYRGGPRGEEGIYVEKLARTGEVLWSTRISPLWVDMVTAVALSPAGELFVTGATFLQLGRERFGQQDAFILKLDPETGRAQWATQAGSSESDYPTALAFDGEGNIYIAGETLGSVVPGAFRGAADVFAMKLDTTGALVSAWQKGSPAYDSPTSMVVDPCGRVLVGGYSRGALGDSGRAPAGDDMFILRAAL